MARTNAERQAAYQKRKSKRLAECVTPDDVIEAVRLMYEQFREDTPNEELPPFDQWLLGLRGQRGAKLWQGMGGFTSIKVAEDVDNFAPQDAALLLKVAAVVRAINFPPQPSSSK
ncbi:hypothetical protein A3736_01870 [Erythrobacter sp. HI0063]|uniref:hypothetical protein n=1 Tax=Erythrobacter sp. HI0063 TaxID=1822240 RepID=UPI0007C31049|nr:hypothetical protein [Erythrobacter sp. HI0063]KZY55399.1 hypothetical protein A3736_01870 [Erythrobacter sp. HI0063]